MSKQNNEEPKLKIKSIFQKEEFVDESKLPWYRRTWVVLTLLFTPISFIGLYLLITQKHYTILFKSMIVFFFILAVFITALQMNGVNLMENMPIYEYETPIKEGE